MGMTPAAALNLLRKALASGSVAVRPHARMQAELAGFNEAFVRLELAVAAKHGTVGRNNAEPTRALAYGNVLTMSLGSQGASAVVVVTLWVQER